jgi:hypothetical protein
MSNSGVVRETVDEFTAIAQLGASSSSASASSSSDGATAKNKPKVDMDDFFDDLTEGFDEGEDQYSASEVINICMYVYVCVCVCLHSLSLSLFERLGWLDMCDMMLCCQGVVQSLLSLFLFFIRNQ